MSDRSGRSPLIQDTSLFRTLISRALLLGSICLLAIVPFFWYGIPSGHDFEFHVFSWMEVLGQWKQGIVYPRWAALAHWGYGEARFLFYPPASWTLGAAIAAVLPWPVVPAAYIWIVLCLAGWSMHRLARNWLEPQDALFAAIFYAVNPYHLLIVYWRSAFAELLAAALLPVLLLWVLKLEERSWRSVLWVAVILTSAWLTNAPAAVIIHYSVALLAAGMAITNRSWRPLGKVAVAIALAAGLASFYLMPAVYEEKWVNIGEVLAPGVRPQDNFLFTTIKDTDHNRFNLLVSVIAVAEIAAVALAVWLSREWRRTRKTLWVLLTAWGAVSAVIMLAITRMFWDHLPKLRFVQLPWRWLLCLNAALAMLLAAALRRWRWRALTCFALLSVVIVAGYHIQRPWWDTAADIREMSDAMADGTGYEGTDEYVPAGADPYELNKDRPLIADSMGNPRTARMMEWGPARKRFVVNTDGAEKVTLRVFNYPAWQVTVNGARAQAETSEVTGQMTIPLMAGANDVQIAFTRTKDRTTGGIVSIASLVVFAVLWFRTRPVRPT